RQLPGVPFRGEVAEDGLPASRDRGGAGEDVIDQQRRAAHHAGTRPDQAGGDDVSAAAERKMLDDLRVGGGDDEDGEAGRQREKDGEILVLTEVLERLLRSVRAGGQTVRTQADPGEKSRQRKRMEELRILDVLRATQQDPLESLPPGSPPTLRRRLGARLRRRHGARAATRRDRRRTPPERRAPPALRAAPGRECDRWLPAAATSPDRPCSGS